MSRYEFECEARLQAKEAFLDNVQEVLEEIVDKDGKVSLQEVMDLLESIS